MVMWKICRTKPPTGGNRTSSSFLDSREIWLSRNGSFSISVADSFFEGKTLGLQFLLIIKGVYNVQGVQRSKEN
jgi:hypothetical protein